MSDIDAIRQRDTDSAETWFKEPPLGACGRAFIDRRRLLAEITQLRGTLSEILTEFQLGDTRHDLQAKIILALGSREPQEANHT